MHSLSGCSRSVFRVLLFLYARVLFFLLLVGRTTRHRTTRRLEVLMLTHQSRVVRFERLSFGYYFLLLGRIAWPALNCCLAVGFQPNGCMPDLI